MAEHHEFIFNESHIPNNPLREDIVHEVNRYIGYVDADDTHFDDYLTIDKNTLAVSHTRREIGQPREKDLVYYDMLRLLSPGKKSFTYIPNEPEIDAIVLDFFPIDKLNNFPDLAEKAILNFIEQNGLNEEAMLYFALDDFIPTVEIPSSMNSDVDYDEDYNILEDLEEEWIEVVDVLIKKYIRVRNDKIYVNKHKLLLLALNNYKEA